MTNSKYNDPDPKLSSRRREKMIELQMRKRNITDRKVIRAFENVMRHEFVSEALYSRAYEDYPLPIGNAQTISQPFIVAFMTQELELEKENRVLEIGTGSGFQCAILAEIAKMVVSVERIPLLYEKAKERLLIQMKYPNIRLILGNGLELKDEKKFDRILVTAGAPSPPASLLALLKPGGKMVIPIGDRGLQYLYRITLLNKRARTNEIGMEEKGFPGYEFKKLIGCRFVPLVGPGGWQDQG